MTSHFIPILSTDAGCSLTTKNWQEAGIDLVSIELQALLMKPGPGMATFIEQPKLSLTVFSGWQGRCVLNASLPMVGSDYVLTSSYDGSRTTYQPNAMLDLIIQLSPTMVILPIKFCHEDKDLWTRLPESIVPFFPVADLPEETHSRAVGVYGETTAYDHFKNYPTYVSGDIDLLTYKPRSSEDCVTYIESNRPAQDGSLGYVYSEGARLFILDEKNRHDHEVIDKTCECPTCQQRLTRAYLHHLYQHTPLLCQRFLIQHNVFQIDHLR